MAIKLSNGHFKAAAAALKIHPAIVKTVAMTESANSGFDAKGRPIILFERHKFFKYVGEMLGKAKRSEIARAHPDICNAESGGYGPAGEHQWKRFSKAFRICARAAMMSCSWGSFQEMGFNYADLGFDSVDQFVDVMKLGLEAHLAVFCISIRKKKLLRHLQKATPDFYNFAEGYNGPKQEENDYAGKMKRGYGVWKKEDWDSVSPLPLVTLSELKRRTIRIATMLDADGDGIADPPSGDDVPAADNADLDQQANLDAQPDFTEDENPASVPNAATEQTNTQKVEKDGATVEQSQTVKNEQDVNDPAEIVEPKPQGFAAKLVAGVVSILGGTLLYDSVGKLSGVQFTMQTVYIICFVIFLGFLGFCVWAVLDAWKSNERTKNEVLANTAIDRKNIVWIKGEQNAVRKPEKGNTEPLGIN